MDKSDYVDQALLSLRTIVYSNYNTVQNMQDQMESASDVSRNITWQVADNV